jgi:hypothetical protein
MKTKIVKIDLLLSFILIYSILLKSSHEYFSEMRYNVLSLQVSILYADPFQRLNAIFNVIISLLQSTVGHRPLQLLAISLDLRLHASSSS